MTHSILAVPFWPSLLEASEVNLLMMDFFCAHDNRLAGSLLSDLPSMFVIINDNYLTGSLPKLNPFRALISVAVQNGKVREAQISTKSFVHKIVVSPPLSGLAICDPIS